MGDGSVVSRCVAFDASQVTGEELLTASGIAWSGQTFGGFGEAVVCHWTESRPGYSQLPRRGTGTGPSSLFVAAAYGSSRTWASRPLTVADGDAEGFRFVPSSGNPAAPPLPAGICAPGIVRARGHSQRHAHRNRARHARGHGPTHARGYTQACGHGRRGADRPPNCRNLRRRRARLGRFPFVRRNRTRLPAAIAGVTASFAPTSSAGVAPGFDATAPAPGPTPGPDLGLLAAALAGGGLGGLALVRLIAMRRSVR